jgi:hypothetical protein
MTESVQGCPTISVKVDICPSAPRQNDANQLELALVNLRWPFLRPGLRVLGALRTVAGQG